jgi:two-component system LytT family response regulator
VQSSAATVPSGLAPQYIRQFAVRRGATSTFVRVADVDWIEGLGDYAGLHVQDKTQLVRGPLSKLVARLDPIDFQRIHRSSIVQVDRIVRMESLFNRDLLVTLRDATVLRVSRTYSASLTDRLWNVTA